MPTRGCTPPAAGTLSVGEDQPSDPDRLGVTAAGLRVAGISHSFARQGAAWWERRTAARVAVLDDVSFDVEPGTLTAIVGPSGCGKSTLLRVLAGLDTPDRGRATAGDTPLIGRPGAVAFHPQRDALLPWMRVIDNATLGAETCGVDALEARADAHGLLERFGLAGQARAWPDELSGGMRQRVALMRTFLMPQGVLALDEPFGALDALTRRSLQRWLMDIVEQDRRPILLVTHDIDEALLLADRVLVFSGRPGRIVHVEERPAAAARRAEQADGRDRAAAARLLTHLGV